MQKARTSRDTGQRIEREGAEGSQHEEAFWTLGIMVSKRALQLSMRLVDRTSKRLYQNGLTTYWGSFLIPTLECRIRSKRKWNTILHRLLRIAEKVKQKVRKFQNYSIKVWSDCMQILMNLLLSNYSTIFYEQRSRKQLLKVRELLPYLLIHR